MVHKRWPWYTDWNSRASKRERLSHTPPQLWIFRGHSRHARLENDLAAACTAQPKTALSHDGLRARYLLEQVPPQLRAKQLLLPLLHPNIQQCTPHDHRFSLSDQPITPILLASRLRLPAEVLSYLLASTFAWPPSVHLKPFQRFFATHELLK